MTHERRYENTLQLGELIGEVRGLSKGLSEFRIEMRDCIEKVIEDMEDHKKEDSLLRDTVLNISQWKNGENGEDGAQKTIDIYKRDKNKMLGAMAVISLTMAGGWEVVIHWLVK